MFFSMFLAPRGKRGWKTFYAVLKGMILYLQKVRLTSCMENLIIKLLCFLPFLIFCTLAWPLILAIVVERSTIIVQVVMSKAIDFFFFSQSSISEQF